MDHDFAKQRNIWECILANLCYVDRLAVMWAFPRLHGVISSNLFDFGQIVRRKLGERFNHPDIVWHKLTLPGHYLSGSFALECLYGDTKWEADDVDIFSCYKIPDHTDNYFRKVTTGGGAPEITYVSEIFDSYKYWEEETAEIVNYVEIRQPRNSGATSQQGNNGPELPGETTLWLIDQKFDLEICKVAFHVFIDPENGQERPRLYIKNVQALLRREYRVDMGHYTKLANLYGINHSINQRKELIRLMHDRVSKYIHRGFDAVMNWGLPRHIWQCIVADLCYIDTLALCLADPRLYWLLVMYKNPRNIIIEKMSDLKNFMTGSYILCCLYDEDWYNDIDILNPRRDRDQCNGFGYYPTYINISGLDRPLNVISIPKQEESNMLNYIDRHFDLEICKVLYRRGKFYIKDIDALIRRKCRIQRHNNPTVWSQERLEYRVEKYRRRGFDIEIV